MNNIIKCPICGKNSAMRYNEKSIYESRCLYSECREVVTVTAKSEVAAKELFAKFGSTNHPKLSIPKKIAQELEEYDAGEKGNYSLFSLSAEAREFYLTHNNIVTIYFASKALGVELVSIEED